MSGPAWEVIDWRGLYSEGWGQEIVPEAFAHPAKYSRSLIRRIYAEMFGRAWLHAGDSVVDPFGGVALGGLDAMWNGLHWSGCELEPRFVALGQANIDLWNATYARAFGRWGGARLLQGDSRNLRAVLGAGQAAALSSPPYASSDQDYKSGWARFHKGRAPLHKNDSQREAEYGSMAGQLGAMPEGSAAAVITSPPFLQTSGGAKASGAAGTPTADKALYERHAAGNGGVGAYGKDTANLGNLPIGDAAAAISSPPFQGQHPSYDGFKAPHQQAEQGRNESAASVVAPDYGKTPGQLAAMPSGDAAAVIASPPFEESKQSNDADFVFRSTKANPTERKLGERKYMPAAPATMGTEAAAAISSPPYAQSVNQYTGANDSKARGKRKAAAGHDMTRAEVRGGPNGQQNQPQVYGATAGQIGALPEGDAAAAISSPPYEEQPGHSQPEPGSAWKKARRKNKSAGGQHQAPGESIADPNYGQTAGQLGTRKGGDTFWTAARAIVTETFLALRPGGHAAWVVKGFVKGGKLQDFPGQWRQLCEAVGFVTVAEVRAWVVEDKGTQAGMLDVPDVRLVTERKSFFRRMAEAKGAPRIDYETVWLMVRP